MLVTLAWGMMWAGLIPLLACALYWAWRGASPAPNAVLLSLGFAVSFLADLVSSTLAQHGHHTWFMSFIWPPIQLGFWWLVIAKRPVVGWVGVVVALGAGLFSFIQGPRTGLEVVVSGTGAILVAVLAFKTVGFERYRWALLVAGVGTLPFAAPMAVLSQSYPEGMVMPPQVQEVFTVCWIGYQAVRLLALCLMARAILTPRKLEVSDGRGITQAAAGKGGMGRPARLSHRPPLAQA